MNYSLPVKPSANLPNDQAVNLCEFMPLKGPVSVGRGTEKFQFMALYLPKSDLVLL
jgi:hypothetical protein